MSFFFFLHEFCGGGGSSFAFHLLFYCLTEESVFCKRITGEKYIKRKKMKHIVCRYITILLVKVTILTLVFYFSKYVQPHARSLALGTSVRIFLLLRFSHSSGRKWDSVCGDTIIVYTRGLGEKRPTFICKMKTVRLRKTLFPFWVRGSRRTQWDGLPSVRNIFPLSGIYSLCPKYSLCLKYSLSETFLDVLFERSWGGSPRFSWSAKVRLPEAIIWDFFRRRRDAGREAPELQPELERMREGFLQEVWFWGNGHFLRAGFIF